MYFRKKLFRPKSFRRDKCPYLRTPATTPVLYTVDRGAGVVVKRMRAVGCLASFGCCDARLRLRIKVHHDFCLCGVRQGAAHRCQATRLRRPTATHGEDWTQYVRITRIHLEDTHAVVTERFCHTYYYAPWRLNSRNLYRQPLLLLLLLVPVCYSNGTDSSLLLVTATLINKLVVIMLMVTVKMIIK